MGADPAQVFVIGLDDHNRKVLQEMDDVARYDFHGVLDIDVLQRGDEIPIADLLADAERQIRGAGATPDAIVGWWDFPVSLMVPVLCQRLGLRSATLESVLRCEHKYWSRLVQAEVIDCHPAFTVVDPDDGDAEVPLPFPFWLKPVKAFSSELAFRISDEEHFRRALEEMREHIDRVGQPFEHILSLAEMPPAIRAMGGSVCLAESVLTGAQCTVEGWVHDGEVGVHGIVDSVHYPDSPSFLRFQLPSTLPPQAKAQMVDVTKRVISHIGLDHCTFNVEFFHDPVTDQIGLLEINPRHSQSHAPLFQAMHGVVNHHIQLQLALGEHPDVPQDEGAHGVAAKWFLRCTTDGVVTREPSPEEIMRLERELDGTIVQVAAHEGERLSELHDQDAYSFKLAEVYLAAADSDALSQRFQRCVQALPFEVDGQPVEIGAAAEPRQTA